MVAGCSFNAVSRQLPETSWSELLAKKLGWELVNIARQGCSNGGIRIQIEEIRRQRPDFAIVGATMWDRMEIPVSAAPYTWDQHDTGWNPPLQQHLQANNIKNGYDRADGIDNVNYGNNNYNMICETIFSLAERYPHPYRIGSISKDTQRGIRAFIDTIYDSEWKRQQDEWIIVEGIVQLYCDGIKFLFLPGLLWNYGSPSTCRESVPNIIPDSCLQLDPADSPSSICNLNPCDPNDDPGYHGNAQSQEIIASLYYNHIESVGAL